MTGETVVPDAVTIAAQRHQSEPVPGALTPDSGRHRRWGGASAIVIGTQSERGADDEHEGC